MNLAPDGWRRGCLGRRRGGNIFRLCGGRLVDKAGWERSFIGFSRFLAKNLLILLKHKLPPALIGKVIGIALVKSLRHLLRAVIVLYDENARPKTILSLWARTSEGLIKPVKWTVISRVAALFGDD